MWVTKDICDVESIQHLESSVSNQREDTLDSTEYVRF